MGTKIEIKETVGTCTVKRITTDKAITFTDVNGHWDVTMVPLKQGGWGRPCGTCGATGYRSGYEFVDGGRCWHCSASGIWKTYADLTAARKAARTYITRNVNAHAKAMEQERIHEQARRDAAKAFGAWSDGREDVVDFVRDYPEDNMGQFMRDMRNRFFNFEPLTENQEAAIRRMIERELKGADGRFYGEIKQRITFSGVISKTSSGVSDYGHWYLVVVVGTGEFAGATFSLIGSSAVLRDLEACEGDTVKITATVKKHSERNDVRQTEVIRPVLVEHILAPGSEPHYHDDITWAGTVDVRCEGEDRYRVYRVNGTRDAWDLVTKLHEERTVTSAYFAIFGYEWNALSFHAEDIRNSGHQMGQKFDCLTHRSNTNYSVTSYRRTGDDVTFRTVAEQNLMLEWRKAFGELQKHTHEHPACENVRLRWDCRKWVKLQEPISEVESRMYALGMPAPIAMVLPS